MTQERDINSLDQLSRIDVSEVFGDAESLLLQQLRQLEWWNTTGRKGFTAHTPDTDEHPLASIPETWKLTKGVRAYQWQEDCIQIWVDNSFRGTVKVVTGGGKTLLALLGAEYLQRNVDKELCIVIVVPTIVLMHQWYDAILEHGNIPREAIGRLGGGYDEDFSDGRRVLITVLASACRRLARVVKKAKIGKHLLLIADECHRTGASEMSKIFKTERRWSMGLSATPERADEDDAGYDESNLGIELGPIIYQYDLADALRDGLVPKFTINHYGLRMAQDDRSRYDALSRSISDDMARLRNHRESRSVGDFFSWARNVAARNKGEIGNIARRFVANSSRRRELLNRMEVRHLAVQKLIERELAINSNARIILFHESIDEVRDIYFRLFRFGMPVIAEHSDFPHSIRESALEHFRRGSAQIIVSARSLIEGFNVPAADVGIIVASSGSVRQRIQSLGRVLRRHRGPNGEEKTSCMHILYAAQSTEEHIYGKVDWNETTGVEQNRFFLWQLGEEPVAQDGPPRTPLPGELQINPESLNPGSEYPGRYEGTELSCDANYNISDEDGRYATQTRSLGEEICKIKDGAGKFIVTPKRRYVLVRIPVDDDWKTIYVMQLQAPLEFLNAEEADQSIDQAAEWAKTAAPGDPYPFERLPIVEERLRFRQKSGGLISKKLPGGRLLSARQQDDANDPKRGADATRVLTAVRELNNAGKQISRLDINEAQHVLYREAGQLFFIAALTKGFEFPDTKEMDQ